MPDDQAERFTAQAARFGRAELTRAADIVSQGLTDMRGATAPRLLLEIMCARILLPGLDHTAEGLGARIDRVERRLSVVGEPGTPTSRPPQPAGTSPSGTAGEGRPDATVTASPPVPAGRAEHPDRLVGRAADEAAPSDAGTVPPAREAASGLTLVDARRLWPGVLERVKTMRRFSWLLLSQNAQVKDLHDGIITIGFANSGAAKNFRTSGADEILHQALIDELGVDWRVEGIIDGPGESPATGGTLPGSGPVVPRTPAPAAEPPSPGQQDAKPSRTPADVDAAKGAIRPTRAGGATSAPRPDQSTDVSDDDTVIDDTTVSSHELLARELGAEVIEDTRNDVST